MHRQPYARFLVTAAALLPLLSLFVAPAHAQLVGDQGALVDSGDTSWTITASLLVLLGGLGGLGLHFWSRSPIIGKGTTIAAVASVIALTSIAWTIIGYSIAFSPGDAYLGGPENMFLANLMATRPGFAIPESAFALFQILLAAFAACLIVGAVADRVRLGWLMLFAPLWSVVVYAPVARWVMGGGWLANIGVMDYAGGLATMLTGGTSALVAAILVGRRSRRNDANAPTFSPLAGFTGLSLLWVGFLAINGGWALGATDEAAAAILNTHLAGASGAIGWILAERIIRTRATLAGLCFGAIAGFSAACVVSGSAGPAGAILVGVIAGIAGWLCSSIVRTVLRIDDTANIFSTFAIGGAVGSLCLIPLSSAALGGIGFESSLASAALVFRQVIGIGIIFLWSAVTTVILGLGLSLFLPLRAGPDDALEQEEGEATPPARDTHVAN